MKVSRPLALGFHGCDKAVAEEVVLGKEKLRLSERPWDWLGHGVYFWEDSPARALRWAVDQSKGSRGAIKTPAVLGAIIDLGNCLNLIDAEALSLVRAAHDSYVGICNATGTEILTNKGQGLRARYLDCAVIETLHRLHEEVGGPRFDSVRGFFIEGSELYPGAGFRELDHIQICVRSASSILGYFLPPDSTYSLPC